MFSRIETSTPLNISQITEQGIALLTYYVNLSTKYILFIICHKGQKKSTLRLYSTSNLLECLKEVILKGAYDFVASSSEDTFILSNLSKNQMIKLNVGRLEILSVSSWSKSKKLYPIDEDHFFIFSKQSNNSLGLEIYEWGKEKSPSLKQTLPIYYESFEEKEVFIPSVAILGDGRFASSIYKVESLEFKILIYKFVFDIKTHLFQLEISQSIYPTGHYSKNYQILPLPDGNLLTYHNEDDELQIWNAENGTCVKKWYWKDISPQLCAHPLFIKPFPDYKHLLIHQEESFYVFNIYCFTLKKIPITNLYRYGNHHILPNCKLLAFHAPSKDKDNYLEIMISHFDTNESIVYQKLLDIFMEAHDLTLKELALRVPNELTRYIMGYAFTTKNKQLFFANSLNKIDHQLTHNANSRPHCSIL